jgi:Electron transfer DM13
MPSLTRALLCLSIAVTGVVTASAAPAPVVTSHRGAFVNIGSHTGTGTATVQRTATTRTLRLSRNFATDRKVIKLHMYLATDTSGKTFVDLGPMKRTGAQTFRIPPNVRLAKYRHAIVWCVTADVPITRARLTVVPASERS